MELLSQIIINRPEGDAAIQLLHGDLTAIPNELAFDILTVSAFRGDYSPVPGTLLGALANKGISVDELAEDKEIDLLNQLSCWLSKPLPEAWQHRFNFRKILCFEPRGTADDAETEVGNLFRGINTFAMDDLHNEIAMPVLATGNRQFPLDVMLPVLLDTAIFWLETGLPLLSLKLVLNRTDQVDTGLPIFENIREQYALKKRAEAGHISADTALTGIDQLNQTALGEQALPKLAYSLEELSRKAPKKKQPTHNRKKQSFNVDSDEGGLDSETTRGVSFDAFVPAPKLEEVPPAPTPPPPAPPTGYDYFISYSHKHTDAVQELVNALKVRNPGCSIFYDRDSIPSGGLWIKMISDAIQHSKNVICVLTPEYSQSAVCWDEFQCAYVMEKRKKLNIRTINFQNDADLPPMIAIYSYIDCTEGDLAKLKAAVDHLIQN